VTRSGEIWLGRALVLAAPLSALRESLGVDPMHPAPDFLASSTDRRYRAVFLYRMPVAVLPEGMSARFIMPAADAHLVTDAQPVTDSQPVTDAADSEGSDVTVTAFPSQTHSGHVDLVARVMVSAADSGELPGLLPELRRSIASRLEALMPFCGDRLLSIEMRPPGWDSDDGWLEDPRPGAGWPAEIDLRLSSRPPIYHLDRAGAAGLGLEGDLLLGWRAGDAIAAELG
jgi:hypothetical protein